MDRPSGRCPSSARSASTMSPAMPNGPVHSDLRLVGDDVPSHCAPTAWPRPSYSATLPFRFCLPSPPPVIDECGDATVVWFDPAFAVMSARRPSGGAWTSPVQLGTAASPATNRAALGGGGGEVIASWRSQNDEAVLASVLPYGRRARVSAAGEQSPLLPASSATARSQIATCGRRHSSRRVGVRTASCPSPGRPRRQFTAASSR